MHAHLSETPLMAAEARREEMSAVGGAQSQKTRAPRLPYFLVFSGRCSSTLLPLPFLIFPSAILLADSSSRVQRPVQLANASNHKKTDMRGHKADGLPSVESVDLFIRRRRLLDDGTP
jgi:hypothetical protein